MHFLVPCGSLEGHAHVIACNKVHLHPFSHLFACFLWCPLVNAKNLVPGYLFVSPCVRPAMYWGLCMFVHL